MQKTWSVLTPSFSWLVFFRSALALAMTIAGILHFVATDAYIGIMPAYLPLHRELVYFSGILEIIFGLACSGIRPERRPAPA